MGEVAQLDERRGGLLPGRRQHRGETRITGCGGVGPASAARRAGEQSLLCAVVEVPLELAPGGVGGLDDPRAGRAQVRQLGERFGAESLVVDSET